MDGRLRIDRDILIITGIAAISGLGICLVFFISLLQRPKPVPAVDTTNTPFKYLFLATETQTPDPNTLIETVEIVPEEGTTFPEFLSTESIEPSVVVLLPPTQPVDDSTSPVIVTKPVATTAVPTVDEALVFLAGTYNDTDSLIEYDGDWTNELFVDSAYDETLYISTSTGNTASFVFLGTQVVIGYFGSSDVDLGTATVLIDGKGYQMNQASGDNWVSPELTSGQHRVVITHKTGDLLFLDYLEIR